MIGKAILHYKILEELGRGGMGVVYKAEDTQLERTVAIKFLPHQIAVDSEERERFKIEAKAAAGLNHPNIATIHAIEGVSGSGAKDEMFIVMEYIDGKKLQKAVIDEGLSVNQVVDIATQICEGLKAAHEKGIVHRDIKSSNIMITTQGKVKIMDFGLAKVIGGAQVTKLGTTLGTAAYMSPEQARGEEVDQRSDIWSFGVVLYEMLTGKQPFAGDYEQAVIYAILNEDPKPIKDLRNDVPEALLQVINRILAKSPDERYQDVKEVLADLQRVSVGGTVTKKQSLANSKFLLASAVGLVLIVVLTILYILPTRNDSGVSTADSDRKIKRIAVLPFSNLREDPETDFLGLALADEIIGDLTYIKSILVRPSSSVRKYQEISLDAPTAGRELQVDHVLTGNYLKEADLIRLNVELVDVNSNEILWQENVEAQYENAFNLQDIVAEKVLDGMRIQFSQEERRRMHSDISANPLAYEYYLRALSYPYSNEGNLLAVSMLNKSIQLDSSFAPAWSELGWRKSQISYFVLGESQQIYEAEKAHLKALSLNSDNLGSLGQLIGIYVEIGQVDKAVKTGRRALKINPNSAENHFFLGYVYRYTGFLEEAEQEMELAVSLEPNNPKFRSIGVTYIYTGKYEKALKGFELDPGSPWKEAWIGQAYMRQGKKERALAQFNHVLEMESESLISNWAIAMKAYLTGNIEQGLQASQKSEDNTGDPEIFYNIANLYGLLGDERRCARALRKAVNGGFFNYPLFLSDSFLDPVRSDPEFQEVLAEAKSRHEAFKRKFF